MGPTHDTPPGLRAQVAAVIASLRGLVVAHIELAKAELSEIAAEAGRLAGAGCAAAVLAILAAMLLGIGAPLFLGEWVFGSIGWGVLHGVLFLLDIGFLGLLVGLRVEGGRIGRALLGGLLVGVLFGLAFGFGLTNLAWSALAEALVPAWDEASRAVLIALLVTVPIGAILGAASATRIRRLDEAGTPDALVAATRPTRGGILKGLFAGVAAGVALGLLTAWAPGGRAGAAIGVTAFLVAWPAIAGLDLSRTGIDIEALKARFMPQATIDTMKETAEWVRARTPLGPRS